MFCWRELAGWNERCWIGKLEQIRQRLQCRQCNGSNSSRQRLHAQTAGGASPVVDIRLLGKPVALDGRETSRRSFKFQFVAYYGAIDSRLKDLLVVGETMDVAAMRIHMDPDALSTLSCTKC